MFDSLIQDAETFPGLNGKATEFVKVLLAYVVNPDSGGINGFLDRFRAVGLGPLVHSWLGTVAVPELPTEAQLESVLGAQGGLISSLVSGLHLSRATVVSALALLVPKLISRLTPTGAVPSVLPSEVNAFIGNSAFFGTAAAAAVAPPVVPAAVTPAAVAPAAPSAVSKWLPWAVVAVAVVAGLSYCSKKSDDTQPAATAPAAAPASAPVAASAPTPSAADTSAPAAPQGAAVVGYIAHGNPMLQVFFDTAKTDVAPEFADKSKDLVAFLQSHADAKAVVSGFNDPTGDAAKNAELSKQRAQAVQAALLAAGVSQGQIVLEKPAETTDAATSNSAARRVDVTIRQ